MEFSIFGKRTNIWLGKLNAELELKKRFKTQNGITELVRIFKPNSHNRLNWKPKTWENMSTVQFRVIGNESKTTIAIHQEKLLNSEQRNEMKEYWTQIIEKITNKIEWP